MLLQCTTSAVRRQQAFFHGIRPCVCLLHGRCDDPSCCLPPLQVHFVYAKDAAAEFNKYFDASLLPTSMGGQAQAMVPVEEVGKHGPAALQRGQANGVH